ncbi:DCC1-like thiol-disulfide oxidoreductase family protein [Desmospora profundinema]|uniref:DCC family thiol-disulfide oxidoreductase YuxK n=1 Tax=Desmospora profundinema TaxID=1571184 RepID=A0ABU1ILU6_9BACL|nr:DCC1-like thiol-disulfide oxidoreductase family protein [Desmospora profundinema]MDR6225754.1 putative DCC family thiol-disulfide oxidoreductase YuxK [Desmospora profundinema]
MFDRIADWNRQKHMLMGASLIRIAFGFIILYIYGMHYAQRRFLWGPEGMYDFADFRADTMIAWTFSLYQLHPSPLYFEIVFHLGMLAALWFIFGYKGRIAAIVNFVFVWSLFTRNGIILDGGDNVMRILLVFLLFANTTAYFSVDRHLRQKRGIPASELSPPGFSHMRLSNLIHNLAILACIVQVCMMYLTSGFHKVMGEVWQNGTALYYILQVGEYTHPFFRDLIFSSDFLIVTGAYATVLVQVAFPFLLFNRYTKYVAMAGVIGMHLGIAVVMGLFTFSFIMIANQLLMLRDREYKKMIAFFDRRVGRVKAYLRRKGTRVPVPGKEPVGDLRAVTVFYDGWCPFCQRSMQRLQRWDWLHRLSFLSFRDPEVIEQYGLDPERLEQRMHTRQVRNGRVEEGIHSVWVIARQVPLLWGMVPFLWLATVMGVGQWVYDWIAARRTVIPVGGCDGAGCEWTPMEKGHSR